MEVLPVVFQKSLTIYHFKGIVYPKMKSVSFVTHVGTVFHSITVNGKKIAMQKQQKWSICLLHTISLCDNRLFCEPNQRFSEKI